ncbi:hypothetical protein [Bifidobacterium samirii]|uniref:Uncharacterized protein n=1 Tax=Bifidobacterium samirii TaxID=2306974 RepID=A0A430FJH7_9BIFI|nr:hypothetical protein [Bifidobacterium samirii]RSX53033.1 hypothetical protein D2E24_1704 [Bifidobacterium samirii]
MDQSHHTMEYTTRIRVMRVDRLTGLETGVVQGIERGGSITRNQDTSIGETASLTIAGDLDLGTDLVRIWADLDYENGDTESIALGTFLPNAAKREIDGGADSQPLDLYGRLRELQDSGFPTPVTLAAGSDPMAFIEEQIRESGLGIAPHDECTWRMGDQWTFGMDDDTRSSSRLNAINTLLDLIGWQSARTDPMGSVVLQPYTRPADRAPAWTFREGGGARFLRSMTDERDWFDTKNEIIVIYTGQDRDIRGHALDDDPDSMFSTVSRGRTISDTVVYNDVPANMTDNELQRMADDKASELLATAQAVIRRITFTHLYAPISPGDVITIDYPSGQVNGDFSVRTQTISLTAGLPVECEAKSFSR